MSDCNRCLWATRNGSCASWDCRFVDQREAYEAYNREKADGDCISRQAVVKFFNDWISCLDENCHHQSVADMIIIKNDFKNLPSVQPRKGKWIPVDSYSAFGGDEATWMAHGNPVAFYYCSECKEQAYAGEDGESLITEYCPNCGADMRGEHDG